MRNPLVQADRYMWHNAGNSMELAGRQDLQTHQEVMIPEAEALLGNLQRNGARFPDRPELSRGYQFKRSLIW